MSISLITLIPNYKFIRISIYLIICRMIADYLVILGYFQPIADANLPIQKRQWNNYME